MVVKDIIMDKKNEIKMKTRYLAEKQRWLSTLIKEVRVTVETTLKIKNWTRIYPNVYLTKSTATDRFNWL